MKIKIGTIARFVALIVVLINQGLAIFGKSLPFTADMVYQVVSAVLTVSVAAINAWKNNDFTKLAKLAGKVLDALKDGKLTEAEIRGLLHEEEGNDADKCLSGDRQDDTKNKKST